MIHDYIAQVDIQQRERELVRDVERRRQRAERAVQFVGGERLALIAKLARAARSGGRGETANAHLANC